MNKIISRDTFRLIFLLGLAVTLFSGSALFG